MKTLHMLCSAGAFLMAMAAQAQGGFQPFELTIPFPPASELVFLEFEILDSAAGGTAGTAVYIDNLSLSFNGTSLTGNRLSNGGFEAGDVSEAYSILGGVWAQDDDCTTQFTATNTLPASGSGSMEINPIGPCNAGNSKIHIVGDAVAYVNDGADEVTFAGQVNVDALAPEFVFHVMIGAITGEFAVLSAAVRDFQGLVGADTGEDTDPPGTRNFLMGFTPWPYAATQQAVDDTYVKIQERGDIVCHHLDGGIPWPEAYSGQPYHPNVEAELGVRLAYTEPDKMVYLAVSALTTQRDGIATYWSSSVNQPMPGAWAGRDFGDLEVVQAYTNFCLDMIDRFQPDYFNYGVESSLLAEFNPALFEEYVPFAQAVYTAVKQAHPNLPTFVSAVFHDPSSSANDLAKQGMAQLADYTDYLGISMYPYTWFGNHSAGGNPDMLPANWLSQAHAILPNKPLVIAENGWIAEDLVVASSGVQIAGSSEWQDAYLEQLFHTANGLDIEFLIWFCSVDYDALMDGFPPEVYDLGLLWRDTGIFDENLVARPSKATWDTWYGFTYTGASAGDVNGDYATDAVDVQLVINAALGLNTGYDCDIDGDGDVDAVDVQLEINAALGIVH